MRLLETTLRQEYPAATITPDGETLGPWVAAILRHLEGQPLPPDLPLDVQATAFQGRVWAALRAIPYGATRSYSEWPPRWANRKRPAPWPGPAPTTRWRWSSPAIAWYRKTAASAATAGGSNANDAYSSKNKITTENTESTEISVPSVSSVV